MQYYNDYRYPTFRAIFGLILGALGTFFIMKRSQLGLLQEFPLVTFLGGLILASAPVWMQISDILEETFRNEKWAELKLCGAFGVVLVLMFLAGPNSNYVQLALLAIYIVWAVSWTRIGVRGHEKRWHEEDRRHNPDDHRICAVCHPEQR